ncbi:MAG TPA: hypothetical protein VI685_13030, partial [Candidatus Angelobacter sp.]
MPRGRTEKRTSLAEDEAANFFRQGLALFAPDPVSTPVPPSASQCSFPCHGSFNIRGITPSDRALAAHTGQGTSTIEHAKYPDFGATPTSSHAPAPASNSFRYARYRGTRYEGPADLEPSNIFNMAETNLDPFNKDKNTAVPDDRYIREIARKVYAQPEPPELAQARAKSEAAEAKQSFWQRHFAGLPQETLDYNQLSNQYGKLLEDQIDIERYRQAQTSGGHLKELAAINRERANVALTELLVEDLFKPSNVLKAGLVNISPVGDPIEASGIKGPYHFGKGLYQTATAPTREEQYKRATEAVGGIAETLNPLLYTEAGLKPGNIVKYVAGQKLAGGTAQLIAEKLGASPELQNFVEATGGLLGGVGLGLHERFSGTARVRATRDFLRANSDLLETVYQGNEDFKNAVDDQDWQAAAKILKPFIEEKARLSAQIQQAPAPPQPQSPTRAAAELITRYDQRMGNLPKPKPQATPKQIEPAPLDLQSLHQVAEQVASLPESERGNAMTQAHQALTDSMLAQKSKPFLGPDHKL